MFVFFYKKILNFFSNSYIINSFVGVRSELPSNLLEFFNIYHDIYYIQLINILLIFSHFLFFICIFGLFLNNDNYLKYLFCFELGLLSTSLLFCFATYIMNNNVGQMYTLFIIGLAAAETAFGLGLLIFHYRTHGDVLIISKNSVK
jgi:NADH-quinone oxidoreductase subunit K